jgi:ATP phosphoribosyltransferase regulatory subunit
MHLDLGHVGIYRALSEQAGLTSQQEAELFNVLQGKAITELNELVESYDIDSAFKRIFMALPSLNGGKEVIASALELLANTNDKVISALNELQAIADELAVIHPTLPISFDLSELRGYHYHTGVVFSTFTPELGREIARGGRYNNIGEFFGRARAATGFSADLHLLSSLVAKEKIEKQVVYAPRIHDNLLLVAIRDLRAKGCVVVQQLTENSNEIKDLDCTAILEKENQKWVVKPLAKN